MKESRELSEIRSAAHEAINRNRNTRQKTVLLSFVSVMIRERSVALREEKAQLDQLLQDTRARLSSELKAPAELPKPGQKKPVQSIRAIPPA